MKPYLQRPLAMRRFLSCVITGILTTAATVMATDAPPLVLKKIGNFFVGGEDKSLAPGSDITIGQMYVEYKIPNGATKVPVIMVHGCCLSSKSWQETPDGRMGWDDYFVRRNHGVYVIDQASRGRSAANPSAINRVKIGKAPTDQLPPVSGGLECVVAIDNRYAAALHFRDAPRAESLSFVKHLAPQHQFRGFPGGIYLLSFCQDGPGWVP